MVYSILNQSDATIKKLYNISIGYHGYKLNGTLINGNFRTPQITGGFLQLVQIDGMVYILRIDTDSNNNVYTDKVSGIANTLLYS